MLFWPYAYRPSSTCLNVVGTTALEPCFLPRVFRNCKRRNLKKNRFQRLRDVKVSTPTANEVELDAIHTDIIVVKRDGDIGDSI